MRGEVKRTVAQLANVSAHMLKMLLRECGVRRMNAGRRVLIPSKLPAESRSKLISIKNARLGFARIIEHPGKAHANPC